MPINPLHYGWDVQAPPRPIYKNGLVVGAAPTEVIHDGGPHFDPGFPFNPGGPFGNPTGSSNIHFNGMVIGYGPTRIIVDPGPHDHHPIEMTPRPGPGETQIAFMARCEMTMMAPPHSMTLPNAQTFCASAWGMGPRVLAEPETASADAPPPPEPPRTRNKK
jgi:hypothetical protein